MGKNAQRRRSEKAAHALMRPATVRPEGPTVNQRRLRLKMRQFQTRVQFEEMIAAAPEDRRGPLRRLLQPMLPKGLPCCGIHSFDSALGRQYARHANLCPARDRVPTQLIHITDPADVVH